MKDKINRFMNGRYGTDELNRALSTVTMIFLGISLLFRFWIWKAFFIGTAIYSIYRMLSRNIVKRRRENEAFKQILNMSERQSDVIRRNHEDKNYKYFVCRQCGQKIRIPRKKGKIEITCPVCRYSFKAKT